MNDRFLLGIVAFGISFGLSLLTKAEFSQALTTGLISLPAVYIAVGLLNGRASSRLRERLATLQQQIRALMARREDVYYELLELTEARDRLATSLQVSPPLSAGTPPSWQPLPPAAAPTHLSWDLSNRRVIESPIDLAAPSERSHPTRAAAAELQTIYQEAAAAQRDIEVKVKRLRTELVEKHQELDRQRQIKEDLERTIETLHDRHQQLAQTAAELQTEVDDLHDRRTELEQFLAFATAKKQELEVGQHPLQVALSQLHSQVTSLQTELQDLETQVLQRRDEKAQLDQQLTQLRHQVLGTAAPPTVPPTVTVASVVVPEVLPEVVSSEPPSEAANPPRQWDFTQFTQPTPSHDRSPIPAPTRSTSQPTPKTSSPKPSQSTPAKGFTPSHADARSTSSSSISDAWAEFLVQLPDYELQALRAIVNQTSPAATIRKIAEDNLTTPEQLVADINERAQEVVGDDILQPCRGNKPPAIVREHLKTVKKLVKTRDYLME